MKRTMSVGGIVSAPASDEGDHGFGKMRQACVVYAREDVKVDEECLRYLMEKFAEERSEFKARLGKLHAGAGEGDEQDKEALAIALAEFRKSEARWNLAKDHKYIGERFFLRNLRNHALCEKFVPGWACRNSETLLRSVPVLGMNTNNSYHMPEFYRTINQHLCGFAQ